MRHNKPNFLFHFLATLASCVFFLASCSSTPNIPFKGQDLDSLEQAANFITTKNTVLKLKSIGLIIDEKAFTLGAYDLRDDVATRVPIADYDKLLQSIKQKRPTFASFTTTEKPIVNSLEEINDAQYPEGLNSQEKRLSYLVARNLADTFNKKGIPVIPASMLLGAKDTTSPSPKLNDTEESLLLKAIKAKLSDGSSDWEQNRKNYYKKEEKNFFAMNITKPGVNLLESGVQYKILDMGKGKKPTTSDKIRIHYRGTLLDGTEFDSSYQRNNPSTFPLKAMIRGFIEAMQQIPEGSTAIIYIPAELAYKERGTPGVPPNAAIVFEIEFLELNP